MPTAFVFAGGGSLGAVEAGMLAALLECGERPDFVVGVCNNTPISAALTLGATRIIVLPTGYACALKAVPATAIGKALHSLGLLVARQLVRDVERFRDRVELHVVPALCPLDVSPYDYDNASTLIDRARAGTREWIAQGGLEGAPQAGPLVEHRH